MFRDIKTDNDVIKILLLAMIFLMITVNSFLDAKDSEKIDYLKSQMKTANFEINKIYESNKIQEKKLENFKTEFKQIDNGITINNKKIQNLNNYEKKQTNSFATYGNSEWEKYFADRYKK